MNGILIWEDEEAKDFLFLEAIWKHKIKQQKIVTGYFQQKQKNKTEILTGRLA